MTGICQPRTDAKHSLRILALIFFGTPTFALLGIYGENPLLLPLMNTVVPLFILFFYCANGKVKNAVATLLVWGYFYIAVMVVVSCLCYESAERAIFHGADYRDEMFLWINTGEGAEGDIKEFLPQHLRDFSLFSALSFLSFGAVGLFMGVVLVNYMAFYTASVIKLSSAHPLLCALLGWHPWSLLRVAGYIIAGTVLSAMLFERVKRGGWHTRQGGQVKPYKNYFLATGILLLADIFFKALFAPIWRKLLFDILQ